MIQAGKITALLVVLLYYVLNPYPYSFYLEAYHVILGELIWVFTGLIFLLFSYELLMGDTKLLQDELSVIILVLFSLGILQFLFGLFLGNVVSVSEIIALALSYLLMMAGYAVGRGLVVAESTEKFLFLVITVLICWAFFLAFANPDYTLRRPYSSTLFLILLGWFAKLHLFRFGFAAYVVLAAVTLLAFYSQTRIILGWLLVLWFLAVWGLGKRYVATLVLVALFVVLSIEWQEPIYSPYSRMLNYSPVDRVYIWETASRRFFDGSLIETIFGQGPFSGNYLTASGLQASTAHNVYLQALMSGGFLGAITSLTFFVFLTIKMLKRGRYEFLYFWLMGLVFDLPFVVASTSRFFEYGLFLMCCGMVLSWPDSAKGDQRQSQVR